MGIIERKHRDRERRIQEILSAGRELFIKKGILKTSMMDIARESDLSRRTLYLYFASKEEIALNIVHDGLQKIKKRLEYTLGNRISGWEKLLGMKEAYLSYYHDDYNAFHSTFGLDVLMNYQNSNNPEVQRCIFVIREINSLVIEVLKIGRSDGSLEFKRDIHTTAYSLMNIVHSSMEKITTRGFIMHAINNATGDAVIETTFELLLSSLKKNNKYDIMLDPG